MRIRTLALLVAAALPACSAPPGSTPATPSQGDNPARASRAGVHVLYSFTGGTDGGNAATGLVLDGSGNLYGTTVIGGKFACGTIFKLAPQASPPWPESVLYNFDCYGDGKNPHGGVTFDPRGSLDGTTTSGGSGGSCYSSGCGVAFSLSSNGESVLHDFAGGGDGYGPGGGVAFDGKGNVYGTTPDGGESSAGVVYEISRAKRGWHETVLHAFNGGSEGGVGSLGLLLLDKSADIFGVTEIGGAGDAGTVYELARTGKTWRYSTLYAFEGTPDAGSPYGGLIADASGDLFGTTYYGGATGNGSVFELQASGKGKYRERVVYSLRGGSDGAAPTSTLLLRKGELYGTASGGGGACYCGTIFEVNAQSGKEKVLHRFAGGSDGAYPYYGLTAAANGELYGTTVAGGSANQGTVFELTP
ncbi:MAG TPA: choice-of-anchor tandem repeat GloVer-containing protein [Candidatus Cybelea sp.]|jgi:uncharacterized repeat protein (TIGR03803 family)|nr:choice-of-anchor tandem repeat GloVer-containing protein [Candidatus Cybelea sp.]